MFIAKVPNRNSPPAYLLRESYREGGKVKSRTLANLTCLPEAAREALSSALKGNQLVQTNQLEIVRSIPHGHVAAVLGQARKLGLPALLGPKAGRVAAVALALILSRLFLPRSKLATHRNLAEDTRCSTLSELLGVADATEDEVYASMDWLLEQQPRIEQALARRHLSDGSLVLYDLSSSYFEGQTCPLAHHGHSRDHRGDRLQIEFGLLCNADGCPVSVEVFEGNVSDSKTLAAQVEKVCTQFGLRHVVVVGDRGMITEARIRNDLWGVEGLDWITALRSGAIRKLATSGALQMELFDERGMLEVTSPEFPSERLIACFNPALAERRVAKRRILLDAAEAKLAKVRAAVERDKRPLRGTEAIATRVERALRKHKMRKHFDIAIEDDKLEYWRNEERIAAEASVDGVYVVRTSLPKPEPESEPEPAASDAVEPTPPMPPHAPPTGIDVAMSSDDVVASYKSLSRVERAFRTCKTVDLHIRPIYHRLADRVRAHVFLCMLAYYVEWHMRRALAPMLFDDADPDGPGAERISPVVPAQRSHDARDKASLKTTVDGSPVHSFHTLLDDLTTICKNTVRVNDSTQPTFSLITTPTELQRKALQLLGVPLDPKPAPTPPRAAA